MGIFDRRQRSEDTDTPEGSEEGGSGAGGRPELGRGRLRYGIDDAIQLMRTLPSENVELVVEVVKRTLESARVPVPAIIDDATHKQHEIETRIDTLKREIADFEQQIAARRDEIARLEADHAETTHVKDHLLLAEKLVGAVDGDGTAAEAAAGHAA
jgi:uncharacterized small protein (DUF1192 family)